MAGNAVKGRPVPCAVAKIAEDLGVISLEWPWMPGFRAGRGGSAEGQKRTALRHGVANRTRTRQHLARLTGMAIVMATETPGPVAMTDVIGISRPVHLHGGKNIPIVYCANRVDGPVELFPLFLEHIRVVVSVAGFDRLPERFPDLLLMIIFLHQRV